jgi:hypothetical protein
MSKTTEKSEHIGYGRELTDDELRVVAGGGSVDTLAAASNKPNPGKMSWEHYYDASSPNYSWEQALGGAGAAHQPG